MMRRLNRPDADALRRRLIGAPAVPFTQVPGRPGLGDYGESPEEQGYDEAQIFRALENPGQLQVNSEGQPIPDPNLNPISFTLYPFSISNTSGNGVGSVQLLSQNYRRQFLLVQNLSAASDLYINFGSDAGLNTGVKLTFGTGIVFDQKVPNNSIFLFFNAATFEPGIVVEGAPTL